MQLRRKDLKLPQGVLMKADEKQASSYSRFLMFVSKEKKVF